MDATEAVHAMRVRCALVAGKAPQGRFTRFTCFTRFTFGQADAFRGGRRRPPPKARK